MLKFINGTYEYIDSNICYLGGGGAGSSGSTSTSSPWSGQQPYLSNVFQQAQNQYSNYTPQYFGAAGTQYAGQSTVAPMNAQENSAISSIGNTGLNGTPQFNNANNNLDSAGNAVNNASNSVNNIISGNPAMNQSIAAGVVPGLESQFAQGNAMNSPAAAYAVSNGTSNALLQNQLSADQTQSQLANTAGNIANTAGNMYQTQLGGQQAALTAGQAAQTQSQNQLQNTVNMFNYQQQLPYQQLNQYANLVNGQYGQTTSNVSPAGGFFTSLFS